MLIFTYCSYFKKPSKIHWLNVTDTNKRRWAEDVLWCRVRETPDPLYSVTFVEYIFANHVLGIICWISPKNTEWWPLNREDLQLNGQNIKHNYVIFTVNKPTFRSAWSLSPIINIWDINKFEFETHKRPRKKFKIRNWKISFILGVKILQLTSQFRKMIWLRIQRHWQQLYITKHGEDLRKEIDTINQKNEIWSGWNGIKTPGCPK